jgi:hypothetical protein
MKQHIPTTIPCPHCGKPVDISRYAVQTGKQGGNVTKRKYGSKHFSEAGKKGMAKRWGKQPVKK